MVKRLLFFLALLFLWFLSSIFFPFDQGFYLSLNIPLLIPNCLFIIIWSTIYFLNTSSYYLLFKEYDLNNDYYFIVILNYLFNQSFPLFFFYMHSLLLSLIILTGCTVLSYFLYFESKKINKTIGLLNLPYLAWNSVLLVLFIIIYIIN